ncbi:MAG: hypothetical protein RXP30_01105 [Thermoplasmata archaeon]|nr:hypothetical protein [Euryarchaeota archaeon]MVT35962.1 hypothetical protein [Euryarchaeota archaeon]
MEILKKTWYFRWLIIPVILVLEIIFSLPRIIPDVIIIFSISIFFFILHSLSRDSLFLYISSIALVGSVITSSFGMDPFSLYTLSIYFPILFLTLIFIVFSWETDVSKGSLKNILIYSAFSILISFLFIIALSSLVIIERDIITLTIMIIIIVLSTYFLMESTER